MKKWLAVLGTLAALSYFGVVRETEARFLRRRACACPPPVVRQPCPPAVAGVSFAVPDVSRAWPPAYGHAYAAPPVTPPPSAPAKPAAEVPITPGVLTPPPIPSLTPPPAAGKLYVLLLSDDKAEDGGDANKAGATMVERLVREGVSKDRLASVVSLTGADITQEKVRDRLAALAIRPEDAVLCYYSGPATYDEASRGYTLTPGAVRLPRSELLAELQLQFRGPIVLLTDAPSNAVRPDNVPAVRFPPSAASLDRLVIGPKRLIDLHAAAVGESAFPHGGEGGLFTLAVVQELAKGPESWPQFVAAATATTDRLYKQYRSAVLMSDAVPADAKRVYREQPAQTPTPLSPVEPSSATPAVPDIPSLPSSAELTLRTADATPRSAEIVVRLPAGARLLIDGAATRQASADRRFETPPLSPGKRYVYMLRAEFAKNGQPAVREERVEVRAGEEKIVIVE